MKNRISRYFTFSCFIFLVACGGGGSSSGSKNVADDSVDPIRGPFCDGADRITRGTDIIDCVWNCATYEGETGLVSLIFRRTNVEWSLFDAIVTTPCP